MDITIKGKKRNQDVRLTDDRLICDGTEYLYSDIACIWVGGLFSTSIDCTYRGRHHAFKIDKDAKAEAEKAAAEAQNKIEEIARNFAYPVSSPRPVSEVYSFCKTQGLKSWDVSENNFSKWYGKVMDQLEPDEEVRLPFQATGFFRVSENGITLQIDQILFAGAATDRRIVFCQGVVKDGKIRSIPYDEIEEVRVSAQGLVSGVFIKCRNKENNVGLKDVSSNLARRITEAVKRGKSAGE